MTHHKFNRDQLSIKRLTERFNKVSIETGLIPVSQKPANLSNHGIELIKKTADRIRSARKKQRSVMLTFGAHTIKNGMSPTLIALINEGWVTHLATNGAGIIHDWELAYQDNLESGKKPAILLTLPWLSELMKDQVMANRLGR